MFANGKIKRTTNIFVQIYNCISPILFNKVFGGSGGGTNYLVKFYVVQRVWKRFIKCPGVVERRS